MYAAWHSAASSLERSIWLSDDHPIARHLRQPCPCHRSRIGTASRSCPFLSQGPRLLVRRPREREREIENRHSLSWRGERKWMRHGGAMAHATVRPWRRRRLASLEMGHFPAWSALGRGKGPRNYIRWGHYEKYAHFEGAIDPPSSWAIAAGSGLLEGEAVEPSLYSCFIDDAKTWRSLQSAMIMGAG